MKETGVGNGTEKRGECVVATQKIYTFLDSEFNVDYDFAIKHDLIL